MPARGQTITWGTHIGRSTQGTRGHWFRRLRQWLAGRPTGRVEAAPMTSYAGWDGQHERFHSLRAESALEHVAASGGPSWLIALYNAEL